MISSEEYERVIESFLMELQGTCASLTQSDLDKLPDFSRELRESFAGLCDPATTNEEAVGLAFGIIDEFIHATWGGIMKESYALYLDMSGGKSLHHPRVEL